MARSHGTRSSYVGGCRCEPCRTANRTWSHDYWQRYRRHVEGTPHVDAAPVCAHVTELRAAGMGYRAIAHAAGLSLHAVRTVNARHHGVRPDTARRLLAVTLDRYRVPALVTVRRVRALAAMGWNQHSIAAAAAVDAKVINDLSRDLRPTCLTSTATALAAAYDSLSMRHGPSARSAAIAAAKGWPPPLAWDDIDDPNEHATGWRRDSSPRLLRRRGQFPDDVEDLLDLGLPASEVLRRLQVQEETLVRQLRRHDRDDLLQRYRRLRHPGERAA